MKKIHRVFKFENTTQASNHNAKILKTFKYDYEKVLEKQKTHKHIL